MSFLKIIICTGQRSHDIKIKLCDCSALCKLFDVVDNNEREATKMIIIQCSLRHSRVGKWTVLNARDVHIPSLYWKFNTVVQFNSNYCSTSTFIPSKPTLFATQAHVLSILLSHRMLITSINLGLQHTWQWTPSAYSCSLFSLGFVNDVHLLQGGCIHIARGQDYQT